MEGYIRNSDIISKIGYAIQKGFKHKQTVSRKEIGIRLIIIGRSGISLKKPVFAIGREEKLWLADW